MKNSILVVGLLSLGLVAAGVFVASDAPDGLEHTMEKFGLQGQKPLVAAPMPDYEIGLELPGWARKLLAAVAGLSMTAGAGYGIGLLLRRRRKDSAPQAG